MLAVTQEAAVQKDVTERRLKRIKIGLMRNPKFALWSGILMVGKTTLSDTFPTACTNGRDEIYGRAFVDALDDKELAFVVLHENLHKALRHLFIWRKLHDENSKLANAACDYVINLMLVNTDPNENYIAMPRKDGKVYGLLDTRFAGMNAKQVFDILKDEMEEGDGGGGTEEGEGEGGTGSGEGHGGFDDHDWHGAKELSEPEKKELEREIDQAIRQGQMNHERMNGRGAGNMGRELLELLEPQIDWREAMREWVSSICRNKDTSSWRKVNRRYLHNDIYMPTLIGERVGRVAIGIDTSGSINSADLAKFLTEVKAIVDDVRPEKIDLIYWDSVVASHEEYDEGTIDSLVQSTQPKGGGGTDPRCMQDYLLENNITPECIVMLTDGYVPAWGDAWNAPILWVITDNPTTYADVGKTIHLKD
jgi:predicted metal-dependent peptidase